MASVIDLTVSEPSVSQSNGNSSDVLDDSIEIILDAGESLPKRGEVSSKNRSSASYVRIGPERRKFVSSTVTASKQKDSAPVIDSVNDQIQIIFDCGKPLSKNPPNKDPIKYGNRSDKTCQKLLKRMFDDIEICHESFVVKGSKESMMKKARSESSCTVTSTTDDIICIDLNDEPANVIPLGRIENAGNKSKRNKNKPYVVDPFLSLPKNYADAGHTNSGTILSSIILDRIGNTGNQHQRYKSPLGCLNSDSTKGSQFYNNINGNNMYNPNAVVKKGLRPVIIDGSNVAFGHGKRDFSTRGLVICIDYFLNRGHWVVAFMPRFRRNEVTDDERKLLDSFYDKGQLVYTPSRYLNGRCIVPYDDRYIVQCAAELGGIIVSTDNYRDLINENAAWRETIERRLLMFTWVGDLLIFPDDPNGREGPRLEEFLRFPN